MKKLPQLQEGTSVAGQVVFANHSKIYLPACRLKLKVRIFGIIAWPADNIEPTADLTTTRHITRNMMQRSVGHHLSTIGKWCYWAPTCTAGWGLVWSLPASHCSCWGSRAYAAVACSLGSSCRTIPNKRFDCQVDVHAIPESCIGKVHPYRID